MSAPTFDLGALHGGLRLPAHKSVSTSQPVYEVPVSKEFILPLTQHAGAASQPVVDIGDRVLRGQVIAQADGELGVPIHAPTSGTVTALEERPVISRYGETAPCIVIESDGQDDAWPQENRIDYKAQQPADLLARIVEGGIVGLGGAAFPTAQKLLQARSVGIEFLILNGVECEPFISCDDALMREHAMEIVRGAQILMHALQLETCFIAVESDKPAALQQLGTAVASTGDERIALRQIPTIYPSGGEDQLVQLLTNRQVPSGGLPGDVGCLVQNVGTAAAVHDCIVKGAALVSRITTITGDGVATPRNVRARIGTPIADIVAAAGGYKGEPKHLVIGGPMTGKSITSDAAPLVKSSNCILVLSEAPESGRELPCIRCGDCAAVCPIVLQPQQLLWYANADNESKLRETGLLDCIECGCCDLACPSHIPLTASFRKAKNRIRELADEKARAERARQRFEARNERLEREQQERDAELARQKNSAKTAGADAIAEILKRKQREGRSK